MTFDNQFDDQMTQQAEQLKLGATGDFPEGKLTSDDEGGLQVALTHLNGKVVINFGKPIAWVSMSPLEARKLAVALQNRAAAAHREET